MWIELSRYQADAERKDAEAEAKLRAEWENDQVRKEDLCKSFVFCSVS